MTITPEKVRALLNEAERWRDASPAAGDAWTKLRAACPDIARAYLEAVEERDRLAAWVKTLEVGQDKLASALVKAADERDALKARVADLEGIDKVCDDLNAQIAAMGETEDALKARAEAAEAQSAMYQEQYMRFSTDHDAAFVRIAALEADNARLREALNLSYRCAAFFASAIKSGERWSDTCEAEYMAAGDAYDTALSGMKEDSDG